MSRARGQGDGGGDAVAARYLLVALADDGVRLDTFVGRGAGISATAARRLIEKGLVRVNGQNAAKGTRLSAGMSVEVAGGAITQPIAGALVLPDPALSITVVYEDQNVVAIDKPAGIPSHPLRSGERGTAANALVARFPDCASASIDPREGGLGHRLDTGTSGVLIAARNRQAWLALRRSLGANDCEKSYLCEVWGRPAETGSIDAEIGRHGRRGRIVRVGGGGRQPRPAETSWRVLGWTARSALVEARLHAGRAHQVRAHLAAAGFPLVGDDRYGTVEAVVAGSTSAGLPRLHLHAAAVRFRHPVTGAILEISAPAPDWARREL
ncbi:MAG: RluA family pseudouridine synthase, partial [Polyangia bacterium]